MNEDQRLKFIDAARANYADPSNDDIEVDDNAQISESGEGGDAGVWVQAWVWVRYEDVGDLEGVSQ